jgi:hypothetical protein
MNDERQAGSAVVPARENSDVNPLRATSRLTLVNARPATAFLDNDVCLVARSRPMVSGRGRGAFMLLGAGSRPIKPLQ